MAADTINHPKHYNMQGLEAIDIIQASMTDEEFRGYLKGNILKYLIRYKHKGKPRVRIVSCINNFYTEITVIIIFLERRKKIKKKEEKIGKKLLIGICHLCQTTLKTITTILFQMICILK